MTAHAEQESRFEHKYLTFMLGEEQIGVPILRVQEILSAAKITAVPRVAPSLKGIMNLRGKILPIVDLRLNLGMEERPHDKMTCFIVVQSRLDGEDLSVGIVVDRVIEVMSFDTIQPASTDEGSCRDCGHITSVGRSDRGITFLLDIDSVIREVAGPLRAASRSAEN